FVFDDEGKNNRKQGRLKEVDQQVLFVAELCQRIPCSKDDSLFQAVRNVKALRRFLAHILYAWKLKTFLIQIEPLRRCDLSFGSRLPVLIDNLCLDNTEYLLRVNVSARFTLTTVTVNLVSRLLEIRYRFDGRTIVRGISTRIHDDHLVKHLVDVG